MPSDRPRRHFDEDFDRARSILEVAESHANQAGETQRVYDLRWSAVAMGVGALDAYFCDAYTDSLASVLRAYHRNEWDGSLPSYYAKQEVPAGVVLDTSREHRPLWSLRMAARTVMEDEDMLTISRIKEAFNGNLPHSQKLWASVTEDWLDATGWWIDRETTNTLRTGGGAQLTSAQRDVQKAVMRRIGSIIQERHDWIHNCARPHNAIDDLTSRQAEIRMDQLEAFVAVFDDHFQAHRKA